MPSLDQISSQRIRELDSWWHQAGSPGAPPARDAFDPAQFRRLLPYLVLSEVVAPFRVKYRLIGTEVADTSGFNFVGRYLDELIAPGDEEDWPARYRRSFDTAAPVYGINRVATVFDKTLEYPYGIWPLRTKEGAVGQFIALEDYGNRHSLLRQWYRAPLQNWRLQ
ncbi:PAS domain-containing protein [Dongia sp.]|uniref:PAS domain-containing protein n=1 Tax=Dongia sp. TaxID=1977262 RepID=UPI0035B02CB3